MASLNSIGGLHYEMIRRCYNPKSVAYKDYGAKGIKVVPEWHDRETFRKWANENGYVKGTRLERIDSSKDYSPDNCRFGVKHKNKGVLRKQREVKKINKENCESHYIKYKGITKSPIYSTYVGMKTRCYDKNSTNYGLYGGRGITICDEWLGKNGFLNFNKWSMDNGWEHGLTIDRIDNEKGYSPDNCRWATIEVQANNKRNTIFVEYNNKSVPISIVSKENHVNRNKLYREVFVNKKSVSEALKELM